jgi:hypothetical protein
MSKDFWKKLKYQVSSKSVQWETTCSMWTDRQDGRTGGHVKTYSRFSQFCRRAEKEVQVCPHSYYQQVLTYEVYSWYLEFWNSVLRFVWMLQHKETDVSDETGAVVKER